MKTENEYFLLQSKFARVAMLLTSLLPNRHPDQQERVGILRALKQP
jgi:hypothetical protein